MKILIELRGGLVVRVAAESMDEEVEVFIQDWDISRHMEPEATEVETLTYSEKLLLDES